MALVDPNKTAQFTCEVEGVTLDWYLSGWHQYYFERVTSNTTLLNASESGAAVFSSHLWVPRAEEFDNMSIVCRARAGNASESQDSNVAWLKLEGVQCIHVIEHVTYLLLLQHLWWLHTTFNSMQHKLQSPFYGIAQSQSTLRYSTILLF